MHWGSTWKVKAAASAAVCFVLSYFLNERWHFGSETLQHATAAILIALIVGAAVERASQQRIDFMESQSRTRLDQAEANAREKMQTVARLAHERIDRDRALLEDYTKQTTEASFSAVGKAVFGAFHSTEVLEEAIRPIFSETLLRKDYVQEVVSRDFLDTATQLESFRSRSMSL